MRSGTARIGRWVDPLQFARFFAGGVTGATANLATVWFVRTVASYGTALIAGMASGFVISFLMFKLFAFRSRSLRHAPGELARFVVVYGVGMGCALLISLVLGRHVLPAVVSRRWAEMGGALVGSASMTVTSYFGHRFWTYRRPAVTR